MVTNQLRKVLFTLESHPLGETLSKRLAAEIGIFNARSFPDGESYLRIQTDVKNSHCIIVADLSNPNKKYLPLIFLLETLRELGAASVGLVAPYLCYMRQDRRFVDGEAITSKLFARALSKHIDWLVTIDPHLHRYNTLNEIYSVFNKVVQGAPALANWLRNKSNCLLVGPDAESEQWVSTIAQQSGHPFVIGEKNRYGDRDVEVILPDLQKHQSRTAVIIDDVISSGQTILQCVKSLNKQNLHSIQCAAIHGIFADYSDQVLLANGLNQLVTSNTIPNYTNAFDVTELLVNPISECIEPYAEHTKDKNI